MPSLVEPTILKAIPKTPVAPKKSSAPKDGASFDDALKDAQPKRAVKPEQTAVKPTAKKAAKPAKAKKAEKPADAERVEETPAGSSATEDTTAEVDQADQTDVAVDEKTGKAAPKSNKPADKADATDDATNAVNLAVNEQPVATAPKQTKEASTEAQTDDTGTKADASEPVGDQMIARAKTTTTAKSAATIKPQAGKKPVATDASTDAIADSANDDENIDPEQIAALAKVSDGNADAESDADAQADDVVDDPATAQTAPHAPAKPVQTKVEDPAPVELGAAPIQQTLKAEPQTDSQSDDASTASPQIAAAEIPADKPDSDQATSPTLSHTESLLASDVQSKAPTAQAAAPARPAPPPPPQAPPEVRFAEANHPQIVTGIRGQLLPAGGTMHIRLDPPELGALQVSIHMQDGVMTASFQTSNDDATKLLSHSLAQLKHVLESQGVSVDKLHVSQAPRDQQTGNDDQRGQPGGENPQARQEQQRREIIQRMWRRLRDGGDPLDMVA